MNVDNSNKAWEEKTKTKRKEMIKMLFVNHLQQSIIRKPTKV